MAKIATSDVNYSLRSFLQGSVLFSDAKRPNGILSFDRLDNSILEDVIIEPLPMSFGVLQTGIINVNIFVPNLNLPKMGDTGKYIDKSQRNTKRLAELDRLMLQVFTPVNENDDAIYFDGYNFTYQQSGIYADVQNQHYLNTRIEFNAITI